MLSKYIINYIIIHLNDRYNMIYKYNQKYDNYFLIITKQSVCYIEQYKYTHIGIVSVYKYIIV